MANIDLPSNPEEFKAFYRKFRAKFWVASGIATMEFLSKAAILGGAPFVILAALDFLRLENGRFGLVMVFFGVVALLLTIKVIKPLVAASLNKKYSVQTLVEMVFLQILIEDPKTPDGYFLDRIRLKKEYEGVKEEDAIRAVEKARQYLRMLEGETL